MNDRQRRNDGAPEQQRPRDRTGRPLSQSTTETLLAQSHLPKDVEGALALGRGLWNQQRFFEAHACLEAVWHAAPRGDRDLWQGVIQIAVAQVHRQRENLAGAAQLYGRANAYLRPYPPVWRGVAVAQLRRYAAVAGAAVQERTPLAQAPVFPDACGGAWFAFDDTQNVPSAAPTPLCATPRWLTEGVRRTPQHKPSG